MRYAIFTDIHANLEALETVLSKIDELAQEEPIDQIWFLGDLVGYGPNPNECIDEMRKRTDVIIAGNHDWAAVGKLDLDDFSAAARVSAEWTAKQLTEENREFLQNLPQRLEKDECTLVHGSPYGPLWEYLTSEVLAERSFQHFKTRFCVVGHTHVPVIFQQAHTLADEPTQSLEDMNSEALTAEDGHIESDEKEDEETAEMAAVIVTSQLAEAIESVYQEDEGRALIEESRTGAASIPEIEEWVHEDRIEDIPPLSVPEEQFDETTVDDEARGITEVDDQRLVEYEIADKTSTENDIQNAEHRLNDEIEELLELLGLSQSMVKVTNEMMGPPEGLWTPPQDYRAIVNPGGVGQPRDGDPRAAFMIYDSGRGSFTFYRVPYPFEKTQEKIIQAGLPQYLAVRLTYGR